MSDEKKLTKKQLKAQQFKKTKDEREQDKEEKKREREAEEEKKELEAQAPKKKRKTRRGKGGSKKGARFIVFVGNLKNDISPSALQAHFKASSPDHIRIRADKGIAFLEFDGEKDQENIQRRMDVALLQHKTMLAGRKINVELTVGGGGNSQSRLEKLRTKNEKLDTERHERMTEMIKSKKSPKEQPKTSSRPNVASSAPAGIHPDRARLLK